MEASASVALKQSLLRLGRLFSTGSARSVRSRLSSQRGPWASSLATVVATSSGSSSNMAHGSGSRSPKARPRSPVARLTLRLPAQRSRPSPRPPPRRSGRSGRRLRPQLGREPSGREHRVLPRPSGREHQVLLRRPPIAVIRRAWPLPGSSICQATRPSRRKRRPRHARPARRARLGRQHGRGMTGRTSAGRGAAARRMLGRRIGATTRSRIPRGAGVGAAAILAGAAVRDETENGPSGAARATTGRDGNRGGATRRVIGGPPATGASGGRAPDRRGGPAVGGRCRAASGAPPGRPREAAPAVWPWRVSPAVGLPARLLARQSASPAPLGDSGRHIPLMAP